ncbi:hypothetical protein FRC02_003253 [Tulasnella sp. 418]|nr:hypothetical protein FRC02_003253 [Tulasnella sp. 418]
MDFDVIPYEDIKGDWKKLGSGSFGNVYKGSYLGIDVAIKEVLPSNDYDVGKYFEREWRLMKEARHPNVVLYLGLSRAPPPDGRIFIISEFIENGNLRQYIYDKSKPFGWRLRLSFMTDIARALAYLHARKCIHRDLKGENLLLTSNGRLKITDFGFARIAARNEEESKRLTFCGTDSYMSPEILMGDEFDLPTDIFSLGIIFCEIIARKLADDYTFKRHPPFFGVESAQVYELASPGCPPTLIQLALDCCSVDPTKRPDTVEVLARLRAIELEVNARASDEEEHVGSIKFLSSTKRPSAAPRIPSFGMGIGKGIGNGGKPKEGVVNEDSMEDSDDELASAVHGLNDISIEGQGDDGPTPTSSWQAGHDSQVREASHISSDYEAARPLLERDSNRGSSISAYSTSVVKGSHHNTSSLNAPPLSSVLTVRPVAENTLAPPIPPPAGQDSFMSIDSFHTATAPSPSPSNLAPSIAAATEGSSIFSAASSALHHRFTLIKPGTKRGSISANHGKTSPEPAVPIWSPFDFSFFYGGLGAFGAKCDLCGKRLGWKPVLECDDCGLRPWPWMEVDEMN